MFFLVFFRCFLRWFLGVFRCFFRCFLGVLHGFSLVFSSLGSSDKETIINKDHIKQVAMIMAR